MYCFSGRSAGHNPAKNPAKGGVHLTALPDDLTPAGFAKTNSNVVKFRLETFNRGNGYVGLEAVKDKRWMERLFIALDQAWKVATETSSSSIQHLWTEEAGSTVLTIVGKD